MALTITSPASIFDMAELSGAISPLLWAVAREMWRGGQTFAVRDGDALVVLAGLYELRPGVGEAWFNVSPAGARRMLEICRAIKLTIRASAYREIVVVCTSDAGRRIARAAGMTFFEATELGEVWSCQVYSAAETAPQNSSLRRNSGAALPISPNSKVKSTRRRRRQPAVNRADSC